MQDDQNNSSNGYQPPVNDTPQQTWTAPNPPQAPRAPYGQPYPYPQQTNLAAPQGSNPGQGMGIASIILSFLGITALIGLILGIISINKSKKANHSPVLGVVGTCIGALNMLIVIPIILTLVVTTYSGIQEKSSNVERQTDINALSSHIEAFYAETGYYPTLAQLNDTSSGGFVETNMPGLSWFAFRDPSSTALSGSIDDAGLQETTTSAIYGYKATQADGVTSCNVLHPATNDPATNCAHYTLAATLEDSNSPHSTYVKTSD